ncbi:DEAD/DEAH box helicase [Aminobacter carboxidus]|uniref:DEAD/DEAH box helicase n=1 Tax=Aminobacter carboxidus TaxID=376165 RepID=A0ABR9GJ95_9HYPH|nr:DEAD/DEAH box helicase [Aminobacter carboxidus]MBE1203681.1 DEAD/DEAH box helicase [Aminobacter carboxidus]
MTPFEILEEVKRRTAEAIIAQSGLAHDGLRRHLRELLAGSSRTGSLLQEPVLEGAHPFVTSAEAMVALSGKLLHHDLVEALDALPEGHDYRFPKSRKPFRHQTDAWRCLTMPNPQSVLVTSGTGSGKTECFLLPILSDLAAQASAGRGSLEGVQAIMLYPLNALIESQKERLSAWTKPFGGKIRFCLYNGDLPQDARDSARRNTPEQVIDRVQLRTSPPPILVTNVTMLEYMLARREDQPIIETSKGKIKWIVLDEAHALVGAAAAEIALLLRRVLLAFDVKPDEVRFVATSATIGSGEKVREHLQRFLADVAGIPDSQVHVIEGHRMMPARPQDTVSEGKTDIRQATPSQLFDTLGRDAETWRLVERLFAGGVPLAAFEAPARRFDVTPPDLVTALSRAARSNDIGEEVRLAPIRLHAFERAVAGVWSCINSGCDRRPPDWPFGDILPDRADKCPCCGAPVLEIVSCTECGEAYLEGTERGSRLAAPLRNPPRDEFAFDRAREGDDGEADESEDPDSDERADDEDSQLELDRLFAANPTPAARSFWLDRQKGWRVVDAPAENGLTLHCEDHFGSRACPHCKPRPGKDHEARRLRPLRFGAPFILGNAAPILLEGVEPAKASEGVQLPSGGRRLLSFTDSRQGTARMAAKLQVEAERNFVRSFVYHQVQASMMPAPGAAEEIAKVEADLVGLETAFAQSRVPALQGMIASHKAQLKALAAGRTDGIAWPELVSRLAERIEVSEWILPIWQSRDEELFTSAHKTAEFLLLREFSRRPKRANSVETLGLARLRHPAVDRLTPSQLPDAFRRRGKTIEEWRSYLDAVLTHFVRANGFVAIDQQMHHWIAHKSHRHSLVGPEDDTYGDKRLRAWPNGHFRANPRSRPVAFLLQGLGLDLGSATDRADLDECLQAAWRQVLSTFSADPERRIFDFDKAFVAPLIQGFHCSVTRRILDAAPFGLTPYGLDNGTEDRRHALPISLPRHPSPMLGRVDLESLRKVTREWIEADPTINELKGKGLWLAFSDRIALFADYARSAEHSAQQDSRRLRRYEQEFKDGRINILNCSTTMEMGVDIGSVSSVMMTNVPPSIANYRQRVGRAGRRGQAVALAFTFCKDRPLDREAFRDPSGFLLRSMAAPKVTLSSRPIVQRHVNAYLLGAFMRERAGDALKMQIGAFLGCPADIKESRPLRADRPVEIFVEWLERPGTAQAHQERINHLTKRSILERDLTLIQNTRDAIVQATRTFVADWEGLVALAKDEGVREAGQTRMTVELKRLCGEFLLSGLADRGFLPGHGFPSDVVTFLPGKQFKLPDETTPDGNRHRRAVGPQRSLDLAIRDYAPGSEVVLDGLVHKSAGVTLNWKRPASEEGIAEIQSLRFHWRCAECGASDTKRGGRPDCCHVCGAEKPETIEFLRPAGFSVDPRERAHAETDTPTYVPPEDPIASTRGTPWGSLPVPELGRFRCSSEGLVYYSNRGGGSGYGYAICLHCGRAEADMDNHGLATPPPALVGHKPLRYRKGEDFCPGNERPFAIKRNVSLGHEITTDVLELQPQHPLRRAGANALVIALREALAQELGIEADEMGFAVTRSRNGLGADAVSLFLFDRAAGGAGFATSFEFMMRPVIKRAERILDCETPGCESGCASCVLTSDAPDGKDELDRRAALDFVRKHFSFPLDLDDRDKFAPDAELSLVPIDEIHRELGRAAQSQLTIFLPQWHATSAATDWGPKQQFLSWSLKGHRVRLALPKAKLMQLNSAEKLALRDFALRYQISLVSADAPLFENGSVAIAAVEGDASCAVWTSSEEDACAMGPTWGRPIHRPLAKAAMPIEAPTSAIDLEDLLPPPGAQLIEVGTELDLDLSTFGARAAGLLGDLLEKCGAWENVPISRIVYQDGYVSSPLVARLLIETVSHLASSSGSTEAELIVETRPPRVLEQRGDPWQLWHDWREAADQHDVVTLLGRQRGLRASLQHKEVPHGRYLRVEYENGARATIVLDQGFGAWTPPRNLRVRHDFQADAAAQARQLAAINVVLQRKGSGGTYVVAMPGG